MTNPEAPQKSDPNFDKYPQTVLVFTEVLPGDALRIDLTREPTPDDHERLRALFKGSFAVLTASDPFGRVASDEENTLSQNALRSTLLETGARVVNVRGEAVDGSHQEESFACELPIDEAAQIAREFRQSAFFWYDGVEFSLVESEGATRVFRLPHIEET